MKCVDSDREQVAEEGNGKSAFVPSAHRGKPPVPSINAYRLTAVKGQRGGM